jgi:3-oxoacyl-[acyl-carrier protein] reductase
MSFDKVALVTGGSKGIGRACCFRLKEMGYKIALHYRSDKEEAFHVASELGDSCSLYSFDLSEKGASEALMASVKKDYNRLDVLVNNAGVTLNKLLAFSKEEDYEFILNTNLRSVFLLSKLASRMMMVHKSGSIINMSSIAAFTGNKGLSLYSATKGAVVSFTKSLGMELAPFGIRVNCVAPGYIETKMTEAIPEEAKQKILEQIPLGRFGETQEIAKAVGFLASDDSSYITGTTLHVNGGMYRS